MSWTLLFEAMLVTFASAVLQVSTGFGFSIVSAPFLIAIFPPRDGITINLFLTFLLSLVMLKSTYVEADKILLKHLTVGSVAGIPIGLLVLWLAPIAWIKVLLAVAIFIVGGLLMFRLRLTRTPARDMATGFLSGFFTTSMGVPGPPLLAYMASTDMRKSVVRSTTLTFYIIVYFVGILSEGLSGAIRFPLIQTVLFLLPALGLGMWLGQRLFHRLTHSVFKGLQYSILFVTGAYLLYSVF